MTSLVARAGWFFAPALADGRPADHCPANGSLRHHPVVRVAVFLAVVMAVVIPGAMLVLAFHPDAERSLSRSGAWLAAVQLVASVVAYGVLCWLEHRIPPIEAAPRRWRGLAAGLVLGAVLCLAVFGLALAVGARTIEGVGSTDFPWLRIWQTGVVAGISEEIIFRGVFFRFLESGLGTWGATALSGAIFGLAHLGNPNATMWGAAAIAIEAGIGFALLYALTRSLWIVIGLHAAWNVVQGPVLGSAISGATSNGSGWINSQPAGPDLLSGGVFGLEGSLLSVLCWTAMSVWLVLELRRRDLVVRSVWGRRKALQN